MVRVNGSESSEALMLHGVPQGSILGPLFFILFINDLPLYTSAQLDLYADDTTVTASADVKDLATLNSSLNKTHMCVNLGFFPGIPSCKRQKVDMIKSQLSFVDCFTA